MFAKDSRAENLLTHEGSKWRYSNNGSYEKLIPNWEQTNLGRSQATIENIVLEYAARTEAGSSAPAPILRPTSKGLEPLDGVQRLAAERLLGTTKFSYYHAEFDSDLIAKKIRIMANHLLAGHPEPAQWTRRQAIDILIIQPGRDGMSVAEVARMGGWPPRDVEEDLVFLNWAFAIRCIGGPQTLNKGVILNIDKAAHMDDLKIATEPIAGFCNDLKRGRFTNGDSGEYIDEFFDVNRKNRKALHTQFTRNLERFREDPDIQARLDGRQPKRLTPEVELLRSLKAARTASNKAIASGTSIPYMEEAFQIWNQVDKNLKTIEQKSKKVAVKV